MAKQTLTMPGSTDTMRMRAHPLPPEEPVDVFAQDTRPNLEEQDLLARVREGDDLAFARLFERHWAPVHRLLARLVGDVDQAGDLAQEVFVQFYRKPPEGEHVPLRAWLYRVAVHRGYNALRSEKRRRTREEAAAQADAAGTTIVADEANRAEERDLVRRTLLRLPERQRDCLILRAEGLSYAEIASALGLSSGSVGTLLARAERAFKAAYLSQRGGM
jgi:RNA polymerase sigma-70 factor, ECF subfamily